MTRIIYPGRAGRITAARIIAISSTGTTENSSLYIRLNDTTDTTLTTTLNLSTTSNTNVTGLAIDFTATSFFECKLVCPTWVTNPTGIYITVACLYQ